MKASPLEKIVLVGLIGIFIAATCLRDHIREFSYEIGIGMYDRPISFYKK